MTKNLDVSTAQPGPTNFSHQPGRGFPWTTRQPLYLNTNFSRGFSRKTRQWHTFPTLAVGFPEQQDNSTLTQSSATRLVEGFLEQPEDNSTLNSTTSLTLGFPEQPMTTLILNTNFTTTLVVGFPQQSDNSTLTHTFPLVWPDKHTHKHKQRVREHLQGRSSVSFLWMTFL